MGPDPVATVFLRRTFGQDMGRGGCHVTTEERVEGYLELPRSRERQADAPQNPRRNAAPGTLFWTSGLLTVREHISVNVTQWGSPILG